MFWTQQVCRTLISSFLFLACLRSTKTHPGPVVHISDNPMDEGKVTDRRTQQAQSQTEAFVVSVCVGGALLSPLLVAASVQMAQSQYGLCRYSGE